MKYLYKNTFKKIRYSLGRFLSLICIVLLGSAFFAGIRETATDMLKTLDNYYDEYKLYDYKIISTYGLTDDDVTSLENLDNIDNVIPSYSIDALIDGLSYRIHAIEEEVNNTILIDGRYPDNPNECLVEDGYFSVGDTITLDGDNIDESLKNTIFTVVGTVNSPMYIYSNKGITNIGNGQLESYIYIPRENFISEYYTEIYIIGKNLSELNTYYDEYTETKEDLDDELNELKPLRETARYEELLEELTSQINKEQKTLNEEKEKGLNELAKAKVELDLAQSDLEYAQTEYENGLDALNQAREETTAELDANQDAIDQGYATIEASLSENNLTQDMLPTVIATINVRITELNELIKSATGEELVRLNAELEALATQLNELNTLTATITELDNSQKQLDEARATAEEEFSNQEALLKEAQESIESGTIELENGLAEYEKNYETFLSEIREAEEKISDAREEIRSLPKPVWYLQDRTNLSGYTNFKESATKIDSIAVVFPVFFLVVVFLMSLNTMTRMIEEEREEIGTYLSLGIGGKNIIFSYLIYVFLASCIGLTIGLALGYATIPRVLYQVYNANFTIPELSTYVSLLPCISIILITLALMIFVTIFSIYRQLIVKPAQLLRPEAPKKGKKVLLERFTLLWRHLSFTWKVTIRNIFRYKKRIIMTTLGILGCTALLLTGFGIRDGISEVARKQYEEIFTYDAMLILTDTTNKTNEEVDQILNDNNISNPLYIHQDNYTFNAQDKDISTTLIATNDTDNLSNYIHLRDLNGENITLDDGVVITEKMAQYLNVEKGDTLRLRDANNDLYVFIIQDICENYVSNYVYMNQDVFEEITEETLTNNTIYINTEDNDTDELSTQLIDSGEVQAIQYTSDSLKMFDDIIQGMNQIVYFIIFASAFLAIVVLYNLTTININERKREIATLKVLGFYDNEVSAYVYRETLILTIIGILLGLLVGNGLTQYVLNIAETEDLLFIKIIEPLSYFLSALMMIVFTIVVQVFTYFSLKKIDMLDSLKSVE